MEDCVKRIIDLCTAKGVTRADLCRAIDVPPTTLSNYIIRGGKPNYDMLKKISGYFGVSIAYIDSGIEPSFDVENQVNELITRITALPQNKQKAVLEIMFRILGSYE